jgi:hypothetical protein
MKQYDKFFEPVTDLSGKGFYADKMLTGKVTYTKKKEDKSCKVIHKSQFEEKEGVISHFGEGQMEAESKSIKTNFTFSNAKFSLDSFMKEEMNLCNCKQPYNVGVKYELPFAKPDQQMFGLYYKLNDLHSGADKCCNYSTQLKAETKKESYATPVLEWQNLFKFKNFFAGCKTKFNTSLAPKFPECEKMLGFQNENFLAYAKYVTKDMKCKEGKATLGLYATKTCPNKNVKCEVGGEASFDMSKLNESENVFLKMFSGNLCGKLTAEDHGVQFKFDNNLVLSTALFVKPFSQLKLSVSDSFNPINLFKEPKDINYRYGFSAEWDI